MARIAGGAGWDVLRGSDESDFIAVDDGGPYPVPEKGHAVDTWNIAFGGGGDDYIFGGYGTDCLMGGSGDDLIYGYGQPVPYGGANYNSYLINMDRADWLDGGAGNDRLEGGGGADTLLGGLGNDMLLGNIGADTLVGGQGADAFTFRWVLNGPFPVTDTGVGDGNRDVVLDFRQGEDKIDLSAYENVFAKGAIWLGQTDAPHDGPMLNIGVHYEGGSTIIDFWASTLPPESAGGPPQTYHDPTGQIELAGHYALTPSDFIL